MANRTGVLHANVAILGATPVPQQATQKQVAANAGQEGGANAGGQVQNAPALANLGRATTGVAAYAATHSTPSI